MLVKQNLSSSLEKLGELHRSLTQGWIHYLNLESNGCMIYLKNKKISLAILLSMFFGFFLGFNNGNVSAVSNLSVTIDSNNNFAAAGVPIFSNCNDASCLSQYKYFHIKCENCSFSYSNISLHFRTINGFLTYINSYYEVLNSDSIEFTSGLTTPAGRVFTFELLTELPANCPPAPYT